MDKNAKEKIKFERKMAVRRLLPLWFLKLIRRRQIPLRKMMSFKKKYQNRTINEPTKTETIAIIVPCYKHAQYLPSAFDSIIKQTRLPNQVVLIDDHSPDNTYDLIKRLVESVGDKKIEFIIRQNKTNLGQAATINKAINLASTDLIMIMNDDDYLMHDAIEMTIDLFKNNPGLALIGGTSINSKSTDFLTNNKKFIKDYLKTPDIILTTYTPADTLNFEDYCSLNMTHTGSVFSREKALSVDLYLDKKRRLILPTDRDFQIRVGLLYPIASAYQAPFCFWRNDASVDAGIFS